MRANLSKRVAGSDDLRVLDLGVKNTEYSVDSKDNKLTISHSSEPDVHSDGFFLYSSALPTWRVRGT